MLIFYCYLSISGMSKEPGDRQDARFPTRGTILPLLTEVSRVRRAPPPPLPLLTHRLGEPLEITGLVHKMSLKVHPPPIRT